jgi:hypothetical protein
MKPLQSKKEVQKLTGRIAALNRFMSKLAERSLPFFRMLRGSDSFQWGSQQQKALDELKEHIQKLPMMSSPQPDQPLILYVSASHTEVSGALMQEKETVQNEKKISQQAPVYFVSEALAWSKRYYSEMEMICYAIVMSV